MPKKILVAYASKYGSTREIARTVAEVLAQRGEAVDLRPIGEVGDTSPYRAVVLGSPIYGTRWLPEAVGFIERHREALRHVPIAYFTVCMALRDGSDKSRGLVMRWMQPQRDLVAPVAMGLFAGALEACRMGPVWRLILWWRKTPQGDFRDWSAIREWAARLPAAFAGA